MNKKEKNKKYTCILCKYSFNNLIYLKYHICILPIYIGIKSLEQNQKELEIKNNILHKTFKIKKSKSFTDFSLIYDYNIEVKNLQKRKRFFFI
jgi:hypothetical protein